MKKQFFTHWFFTGSILLFLLLNLIFSLLHAGNNFCPALADLIPVLIFALPTVVFRSRTVACISVIAMAFTLTIRVLNYGCFVALKEPLTYPVFRLLSEHTEHASLAAVFGAFYYVGVILLILLVIFPALRSRANIWSKAYGRPQQQTPQEDNRDVVDVDATVVEDDALPAADQQKDGQ